MTIDLIAVLASASAVLATRTSRTLWAYVVLAALATFIAFTVVPHDTRYLLPLAVSALLKIVVAPIAVSRLLRTSTLADDLRPAISAPLRVALIVLLYVLAAGTAAMPALHAFENAKAATFALLCGAAMMMTNRNLLAGLVGLLVLDAGASLAGASFAAELPAALDMGAAFDALLITLIAVLLARALARHEGSFDVRALRRLRG